MTTPLHMRWLSSPAQVDLSVRLQLLECWTSVSNAGGAVGFPFLPVSRTEVSLALDEMLGSLKLQENRLLVALNNDELAGWLLLCGNSGALTAHWARVLRVQTALGFRKSGVGHALMAEVARAGHEDLALEQLRIEVRSGIGLEGFYESCGWRETGRWPSALRFPEEDRDEVLMVLEL